MSSSIYFLICVYSSQALDYDLNSKFWFQIFIFSKQNLLTRAVELEKSRMPCSHFRDSVQFINRRYVFIQITALINLDMVLSWWIIVEYSCTWKLNNDLNRLNIKIIFYRVRSSIDKRLKLRWSRSVSHYSVVSLLFLSAKDVTYNNKRSLNCSLQQFLSCKNHFIFTKFHSIVL